MLASMQILSAKGFQMPRVYFARVIPTFREAADFGSKYFQKFSNNNYLNPPF
jgi:hypothetical protein